MAKVTPWEVSGKVDYTKLIKQFGVQPWSAALTKRIEKITGKKPHPYLTRGIVVSHRDMKWLLDEYEKGNKFVLYTGRGPSGNVHLGHLTVWIFTKWLADAFDADLYFQMTDDEKFFFKDGLSLEDANALAYENALDVIALGFKPEKTFIFSDVDAASLMYPLAAKVAKKLTASTVKAAFGLKDSDNVGKFFYTSMQAVPAMLPSIVQGKKVPVLIPHAIDQDPHFRITRDILPKLGFYKPAAIHSVFLPGLGGSGKLSSSEGQTISTTDTPKEVKKKINKYAFSGGQDSLELHRKHGGNPDVDIAFIYLQFFLDDDEEIERLRQGYLSGEILSGEMKARCIEVINDYLAEYQKKREAAKKLLPKYMETFEKLKSGWKQDL